MIIRAERIVGLRCVNHPLSFILELLISKLCGGYPATGFHLYTFGF
jgi:hypothetical protein